MIELNDDMNDVNVQDDEDEDEEEEAPVPIVLTPQHKGAIRTIRNIYNTVLWFKHTIPFLGLNIQYRS